MIWQTIDIITENGLKQKAQAPIIVSASRSTDIPAFYSDWFFHRLKEGYSAWINPFNGKRSYVSFANTRLIVFWSKNPEALLLHLTELQQKDINCYIQFTLNDYFLEGLEKGVPPVQRRIDTFRRLVDKIGFGKVIWRYDPLILTETISVPLLLEKIESIGEQLNGYTEKLIFSFADITSYRGVKSRLEKNNIKYKEFDENEMWFFAKELKEMNAKWNFELATCGEKKSFDLLGIKHNRCIDDNLIIKYFSDDKRLMKFIGYPDKYEQDLFSANNININKDKGQRELCGCIYSKDIGEYDTCPHQCEYCYANRQGKNIAVSNYLRVKEKDFFSETITGK